MKNLILFSLALFFSSILVAQNVDVIWQHGLGGDETSWGTLSRNFANQRRMQSVVPNLQTETFDGVRPFSTAIVNNTRATQSDRTIGIGHSMGGVAMREIATRTSPGHVDAIVTVGSPMNGAQIADGLFNGEVSSYIQHGARELQKGPRRQFFISYIVVRGTIGLTLRTLNAAQIHEMLFTDNGLDEVVLSTAESLPATRDLSVNGAYMRGARNLRTTTPRVSLFGNENRPVHYRMASSFAGVDDEDIPVLINKARGVYNTFYQASRWRFFSPIAQWRASGWKAGRNYLDSGSETGWNLLIGANRTETVRTCRMENTCGDPGTFNGCIIESEFPIFDCDDCIQEICRSRRVIINEPSDGLINQSSQVGGNSPAIASRWNPERSFEVLGANHLEQTDHPGVESRFNQIFDRSGSISAEFEVRRR